MGTGIAVTRLGAAALLVVSVAAVAPAGEPTSPRTPSEGDRCAVCGMFVAPHTEWLAQVVFDDGSAAFFDGAKDLFRYLFARDRYLPQRRGREIVAMWVTSYYDLEPVDARTARFVAGSDVLGPMGAELVPFATREDAEVVRMDHAGSRIVRFGEVTRELLTPLV
mgnify:CR=1 FL=1